MQQPLKLKIIATWYGVIIISLVVIEFMRIGLLPQNALRRDCNGRCIEWIEGQYLYVVAEV